MIIVGLTGAIGSGKSTFGSFLGEQAKHHLHLESSTIISEVANDLRLHNSFPIPRTVDIPTINQWLAALPLILEDTVHRKIDWDGVKLLDEAIDLHPENYQKLFDYIGLLQDQPELRSGSITSENKAQHRALLQWLGGYLAKQVRGDIWYRELIERSQAQGDIDLLTLGGVRFPADADCIRQNQGLIIEIQRPSLAIQDAYDVTERERNLIEAEIVVINDGSLEQLERVARHVYGNLQAKTPKPRYIASAVQ